MTKHALILMFLRALRTGISFICALAQPQFASFSDLTSSVDTANIYEVFTASHRETAFLVIGTCPSRSFHHLYPNCPLDSRAFFGGALKGGQDVSRRLKGQKDLSNFPKTSKDYAQASLRYYLLVFETQWLTRLILEPLRASRYDETCSNRQVVLTRD